MSDILSWIRLPAPLLIGHRGFPAAARENTLPAFEAALEAGCDGIELDVRLTRDGVAVVHHDAAAHGPAGPLSIEDTDWPALEGVRFDGGGIYTLPRLEDVLQELSGRCLINVELKTPGVSRRVRLAETALPALERVRPRESLLVSSFDGDLLAAVRRLDRSLFLGFLFSELDAFNHLEEEEIVEFLAALHPRHDLVDARLMRRAGERGLGVHVWTVDDPDEAERVVQLGVSSVITNRPDRIGDVVAAARGPGA